MRYLIIVLLFLSVVAHMCNSAVNFYTEPKNDHTPSISEEDCYIQNGNWVFVETIDAYNTDLSGFTCIFED